LVVYFVFSAAKNVSVTAFFSHEAAGIISARGSEVKGVAVGGHVVASLIRFRGTCENYTAGCTFDCLNPGVTLRGAEDVRISEKGTTMVQASGIDEYTERVLVHENRPAAVDTKIPFPHAVSRVHR
jgi:alcohol dehydrogenase/S-(hydroxymethyl)glutathione dehydrogenase/alcohol dehydrogenase